LLVATAIVDFQQDNGTIALPFDLSPTPLAFWLPGTDGGLQSTPITGGDGGFTVAAPSGTYYLQYASDYIVSDSLSLDLGFDELGRPDAAVPQHPTELTLNGWNMQSWATGDFLEIFSSNSRTFVGDFQGTSLSAPQNGDTSFAGVGIDFSNEYNLVKATDGDTVFVTQIGNLSSSQGVAYLGLVDAFSSSSLVMTDNTTTMLDGGFTTNGTTVQLSASVQRSSYDVYQANINPASVLNRQRLFVYPQPEGSSHGVFSVSPDLVLFRLTSGTTNLNIGNFSVLNPFPQSWPLIMEWDDNYAVTYTASGALPAALNGGFTQWALASTITSPIVPIVGPVQSPLVNGHNMFTTTSGVGLQPTISWTAPSVGSNFQYQVGINEIIDQDGTTNRARIATFYTKGTSITVPPGLIQNGNTYFIRITSEVGSIDRTRSPYRQALPDAICDVLSPAFTP
jgi:hypothetical protein